MKKFGLQLIITLALGFLAHQFFPFWVIAPVSALVGLIFRYENSAASFASGLAAGTMLWSTYALFLNIGNASMLSAKVGEVFMLNGAYISYITGTIGGLLSGFGAMTGTLARKIFERPQAGTEAA